MSEKLEYTAPMFIDIYQYKGEGFNYWGAVRLDKIDGVIEVESEKFLFIESDYFKEDTFNYVLKADWNTYFNQPQITKENN